MEVYEYMKIKDDTIPLSIIKKYDLQKIVHNVHICLKIHKIMHGLKQARILANLNLEKPLKQDSYIKIIHTIGLWKHRMYPIPFTLCIDDLG